MTQPRSRFRKMGPLAATHPAVGEWCYLCDLPIAAGDVVTLVPTKRVEAFLAEAKVAHHSCAEDLARRAEEADPR